MAKKQFESSPQELPLQERSSGISRQEELENLATMSDDDIDCSDIPEIDRPEKFEVGKFYRPIKQQITIRLDKDVLSWFRARGGRYQSKINQVLRRYMMSQSERAK